MLLYLGTHMPNWLGLLDVPLFVSHRRLKGRKTFPRALTGWGLDSGGFTELSMHGGWMTTEREYVEAVTRYRDEIGRLEWAAPMDWMCEPRMLERTGKDVPEHQRFTVENYLRLAESGLPFIPVLQGWERDDYLRCWQLYEQHGVHLEDETLVGVGSVCRRQSERDAALIFNSLQPLNLHGFGVKLSGLRRYREHLTSCDSMAWSYNARRNPPLPGCSHKTCANCPDYALLWRERVLSEPMTLWEAA